MNVDRKALKEFWYWVNEREQIRIRRASGKEKPWTKDPILQQYRFCNVRREDDAVTEWVRDHIRETYPNEDSLWIMLALARWINCPDTLQELMDKNVWPVEKYQPAQVARVLEARRKRGERVFNPAYIINAAGAPEGWSKAQYIAKTVIGECWRKRKQIEPLLHDTVEQAVNTLQKYPGWGPFMSYQVVIDLTWTRYLENAPDLNTFSVMGPGSTRGIRWLIGHKPSKKEGLEVMRNLYEAQDDWLEHHVGHVRLSDIQNCLCEFDKYYRTKQGKSKPKRIFKGV